MLSKKRALLVTATIAGSAILAISCKTPQGSGVMDSLGQDESAKTGTSVPVTENWWSEANHRAAELAMKSKAAFEQMDQLHAMAVRANIYRNLSGATDGDRAAFNNNSKALQTQIAATMTETRQILEHLEISLRRFYATSGQKAPSMGANDQSDRRHVEPISKRPRDEATCNMPRDIESGAADRTYVMYQQFNVQNWGLGGPNSLGDRNISPGAAEMANHIDIWYQKLNNDFVNLQRKLIRAHSNDDFGNEGSGLVADLKRAYGCAQDLQRRIKSWFDANEHDYDTCAPLAASSTGGFKANSCRWFPAEDYVVKLYERNKTSSLDDGLHGYCNTAEGNGRTDPRVCIAQHRRIKEKLQKVLDYMKQPHANGSRSDTFKWVPFNDNGTNFMKWAEVGTGLRVYVIPGIPTEQMGRWENTGELVDGGGIVCDIRKQTIKIPTNYGSEAMGYESLLVKFLNACQLRPF